MRLGGEFWVIQCMLYIQITIMSAKVHKIKSIYKETDRLTSLCSIMTDISDQNWTVYGELKHLFTYSISAKKKLNAVIKS